MKIFIWSFALVVAVGLFVAAIYGFSRSKSTPLASANDPNRPVIEVAEPTFDFGNMNVKDKRDHEFTVKNTGKSDLVLKQFTTSCGCTYGNVIQDGQTGPKFSMHINSDWETKLAPDKSLVVKVVYDPSAMPVEGSVERMVNFATNDPLNPSVELKLKANVSK